MSTQTDQSRLTVTTLRRMKREGQKIVCLTAYEASYAAVLDEAGVDVILVGDTLGMLVQGHETTVPVTVGDMLYHARCVARGCRRALLMVDMPFLSYTNPEQALMNAGRILQECGAQMVKLEVGARQVDTVAQLAANGIPVCAHLGLTPQFVHKLGGYRVQGRDAGMAEAMLEDALALESAGADALLLECVPESLAARITEAVTIPVIGIGAGGACDGQVLVLHDVLGVTPGRIPKFARNFLRGRDSVQAAVGAYVEAVRTGAFPTEEHSFS